jgi:hypothetical protein
MRNTDEGKSTSPKQGACPNCSMPREDWPEPKGFDGVHCCEACAQGETCTCEQPIGAGQGASSSSGKSSMSSGNRPDQGTNRGNVDADRQRSSSGQPGGSDSGRMSGGGQNPSKSGNPQSSPGSPSRTGGGKTPSSF